MYVERFPGYFLAKLFYWRIACYADNFSYVLASAQMSRYTSFAGNSPRQSHRQQGVQRRRAPSRSGVPSLFRENRENGENWPSGTIAQGQVDRIITDVRPAQLRSHLPCEDSNGPAQARDVHAFRGMLHQMQLRLFRWRPQMNAGYAEFRITGIRRTAGLCALSACFGWWGPCRWCFRPHNPGGRCYRASESSQPIREVSEVQSGRTSGVSGS